jgi:hypothetical protein
VPRRIWCKCHIIYKQRVSFVHYIVSYLVIIDARLYIYFIWFVSLCLCVVFVNLTLSPINCDFYIPLWFLSLYKSYIMLLPVWWYINSTIFKLIKRKRGHFGQFYCWRKLDNPPLPQTPQDKLYHKRLYRVHIATWTEVERHWLYGVCGRGGLSNFLQQ